VKLKQIIKCDNAPALEATWVDENDTPIKCKTYSNAQTVELLADLGEDRTGHEETVAEVAATYVPPTAIELAIQNTRALAEAEDAADKAGVFDLPRTEFLAKIDKMLQTPEGTQRLIKMMARIVRKVN